MNEATRPAPAGSSGMVVGGRTPIVRWFRSVGWRHVVAWLALVFAIFPVVWAISASFNPLSTLVSQKLIPDHATLDNYKELFSGSVPYTA